jgi:predicted nucleic acid-binding protein
MFALDASVHINALNTSESGNTESQACLQRLVTTEQQLFSPTLLLVEVAAATARAMDDTDLAIKLVAGVRSLPKQVWVSLDGELADLAAQLGAQTRLRGADAVYVAVAQCYGTTLITRDRQHLERLPPLIEVITPEDALDLIDG